MENINMGQNIRNPVDIPFEAAKNDWYEGKK